MIASVDGEDKSMLAVASDIMAAVTNYDRGGIEALPLEQLHEQMDDPDGELSSADVCSISIQVASGLIAMAGERSNAGMEHSAQVGQVPTTEKMTRREEDEVVVATTVSQPITVQQISQSVSSQSVQQSVQQTTVGVNCQGCDPPEPLAKDGAPSNWSVPLSAEQTTTGRTATEIAVQRITGDLQPAECDGDQEVRCTAAPHAVRIIWLGCQERTCRWYSVLTQRERG